MIAGAPGARGSLVIFNSSGEAGWKPWAQAVGVGKATRPRTTSIESVETANEPRIDIVDLTQQSSRKPLPLAPGKEARFADIYG